MTLTRNSCLERDAADPIAPLRDAFALPDGVIYLDGNSLGARPKAALARAQEVVASEWGDGLIRSWNQAGWFELPRRLGNKLAPLIGAREDEVVVTDTTSINLFKVLAAAIRVQREDAPNRKIIVSETHNFPTDLYIAEGLADLLRDGYKLRLIDSPDELEGALGDDVAITMLTHVNYKSGHMYDMAAVSALAHKHGALAIWDLAHSAGAVPVDLHAGGMGVVGAQDLQRRHQAQVAQRRRMQLFGDAALVGDDLVQRLHQVRQPLQRLGRTTGQARADACCIQLGRREQRAQLVMQFARQSAALVFTRGLQMVRQFLQLHGALRHLGLQPSLCAHAQAQLAATVRRPPHAVTPTLHTRATPRRSTP
jgi:hypothetical protein